MQVYVDPLMDHKYVGIEFVMDQSFYSTYAFGKVCFDDKDREFHWPDVYPSPKDCTPFRVANDKVGVTIPITMTKEMHHAMR